MFNFNIRHIEGICEEASIFIEPSENNTDIIASTALKNEEIGQFETKIKAQNFIISTYKSLINDKMKMIKMTKEMNNEADISDQELASYEWNMIDLNQSLTECKRALSKVNDSLNHDVNDLNILMINECARAMIAIVDKYQGHHIPNQIRTVLFSRLKEDFTYINDMELMNFSDEIAEIFQKVANGFNKLSCKNFFMTEQILGSHEKISQTIMVLIIIALKYQSDFLYDNKTWSEATYIPINKLQELEIKIVSVLLDFNKKDKVFNDDDNEISTRRNISNRF